jgi:hypothetical protein
MTVRGGCAGIPIPLLYNVFRRNLFGISAYPFWKMKKKQERVKIFYKLKVLEGIEDALREVKDVKAGRRKKGRTLEEFPNEI